MFDEVVLPDGSKPQAQATAMPQFDEIVLPDGSKPAQAQQDVPSLEPQVITPDAGPVSAAQYAPMSPEEQSRTGQVAFEPNAATAGTEPTPLAEALRANVQPMLEHPIQGMESMFTNWDDLAHLYHQPQDLLGPTAKRFAGMPVSPEEEIGSQNFYNTGVGALMAAGAMRGSPIEEIRKALSPEDVKPSEQPSFSQPGKAGFTGEAKQPWEQPPEQSANAPESPVARSDAQSATTTPASQLGGPESVMPGAKLPTSQLPVETVLKLRSSANAPTFVRLVDGSEHRVGMFGVSSGDVVLADGGYADPSLVTNILDENHQPVWGSDAQAGSAPQERAKVEPQTQRYQQSEPTEQEVQAANATGPEPAPAPEEATEPAPSVREAISLDELRLMRERSDLQLQNDLAKRATGSTHPAVDERIGQINDELDNIANQHLDTTQAVPEGAFDTLREPLNLEIPNDEPANPQVQPQAGVDVRGQQPAEGLGGNGVEETAQPKGSTESGQPAGPVESPQAAGEPVRVGASHRRLVEQFGEDAIKRGEVDSPAALQYQGYRDIQKDPSLGPAAGYKISRDLPTSTRELGHAIAYGDMLNQHALDLERTQGIDSPTYVDARNAAEQFAQGVTKKIGTQWGERGRQLQDINKPPPQTYTGMRQAYLDQFGKEAQGPHDAAMRDASKGVKAAQDAAAKSINDVADKVIKATKEKPMSIDELRDKIGNKMKDYYKDCLT
jgi:hypothetical protein